MKRFNIPCHTRVVKKNADYCNKSQALLIVLLKLAHSTYWLEARTLVVDSKDKFKSTFDSNILNQA